MPRNYSWVNTLSPREHDVGKLVIQGYSNKRIAHAIGVSEHTAKFHVANFIAKMDAATRVDAAVKFARWLDKQPESKHAGVLSAVG